MKENDIRTIRCTICSRTDMVRPFKNGYICEECVRYMVKGIYEPDGTDLAAVLPAARCKNGNYHLHQSWYII